MNIDAIQLKISLTKTGFDMLNERKPITDKGAGQWIKDNIVGRITKKNLDDERARETNTLDMMQNSNIIYHPESIIEMQMNVLLIVFLVNTSLEKAMGWG